MGELHGRGGLARAQKAAGTAAALAPKGRMNINKGQASLPSWETRSREDMAEASASDAVGHSSPLPLAGYAALSEHFNMAKLIFLIYETGGVLRQV